MDDVPIATNNPVKIKSEKPVTKTNTKKKSHLLDTLKNFFFMFPLACIIFYQLYNLGICFGEFITFPPMSVISYIFIGSILLMLLAIQIMMRSIIYSVLAGIFFIFGIFSAWFGNVYEPVINNLSSIIDIVQSAWTRKNIPYELLVTGTMTGIIAALTFIQFITALIVKSFFEMIFGKEWGDGKWMGYVGAIALILGLQIGFSSYNKYSNNNEEKLIWQAYQKYSPLEKFVTRTSGNVSYDDNYIWINNGKDIRAFSINEGKEVGKTFVNSSVVIKGIEKANAPIVATENKFICYTNNLGDTSWEIPYPEMTASDTEYTNEEITDDNKILIPLTTHFLSDGKYLLAFYEFGKIAVYDVEKGEELWLKTVDQPSKVSRMFPEKYLSDISYIEHGNKLVIACQNGFIKCLDIKKGTQEWEYQHTVSKIGGRAQRGLLSENGENLVVSFKTGEIVTLSYKDGHLIHKIFNESFTSIKPVWINDRKAHFITEDGLYYAVELDGGNVDCRLNALPNKADIYPIVFNNEKGIYAHREKVYYVNPEEGITKLIFTSKNRTFVTTPVFEDKTMYIGTADGWIFCMHIGSESIKWTCHVNGELMEDSLKIEKDKLIVKTKSDSVFVFKKGFNQ